MTLIADEKKEHNLLLQKRTVEMEHVSWKVVHIKILIFPIPLLQVNTYTIKP